MMPEELQILTLAKNGENESFIHELEKIADKQQSDLSKEEIKTLIHFIPKAYRAVEKSPDEKTLKMLAVKSLSFGDKEAFAQINKFAAEKLGKLQLIQFLVGCWPSLISNGFVEESDRTALMVMDKLYSIKRYEVGISFCEEILEKRGDIVAVQKYFPYFLLLKGDQERIREYFENIWTNLLKGKETKKGEALKAFAWAHETLSSSRKKILGVEAILLCSLVRCFKLGEREIWMRKAFVNNVYELLLKKENKYETLLSLFHYHLSFSKKKMGTNLLLYLDSQHAGVKPWQRKVIDQNSTKLKALEDIEEEVREEDFDMGEDLLEEEDREAKGFTQVRHLERDIQFLKELGEEEKAIEKMRELKDIDPENQMIKDLHELESFTSGTQVIKKTTNTEKIIKNLMDEIDKHVKFDIDKEDEPEERHLKTAMKMIPDADFLEKANDLFISVYQMNFYKLADDIASRAILLLNKEEVRARVEFRYLRVEALLGQRKFHEALDICREDLQSAPLMKRERTDFLYLSGECLMHMGNRIEAYNVFKEVEEVSPNYRLVKQRLKKLEKY